MEAGGVTQARHSHPTHQCARFWDLCIPGIQEQSTQLKIESLELLDWINSASWSKSINDQNKCGWIWIDWFPQRSHPASNWIRLLMAFPWQQNSNKCMEDKVMPYFKLNKSEEEAQLKTSPVHVLLRCCLARRVPPTLCVFPCNASCFGDTRLLLVLNWYPDVLCIWSVVHVITKNTIFVIGVTTFDTICSVYVQ